MQNLARVVVVLFGLFVGLVILLALSLDLRDGKPFVPLTAEDVTGTWQGDRGGRLEVLADGRVRLAELSGWPCTPGPKRAVLTGEGSWIIDRHSDEDPGIQILIKFPVDGTPAVQACDNWFTLHGTGKEGATGDGSDVWATFLGYESGAVERFRRAATG
ncbi:hypothetical protein [Streptomyces sp. NBC_01294]|uniref:hypothetical protein n=1 Tax=Streptomyces sp. NBC_01294 TaxID=2903815 RepID=UPI002DDA37F8|nr:hypothetical protein [Streptomyces sp. NBC_01294]WRZ56062.1 hypothetical protein OG534_05990 [Streptomyces sp. NBC_01294]